MVDTLNQFIDILLVFQVLRPRISRPSRRVVLFGNGGGTSVLAADYYARLGLSVGAFSAEVIKAFETLRLPPGASVANPVDCPVGALKKDDGKVAEGILEVICAHGEPDVLVVHLNLAAFVGRARPEVLNNLVDAVLRVRERYPERAHFVLVLRSDGESGVEARKREFRTKAVRVGIPVFDELTDAGHALAALRSHEEFVHKRQSFEAHVSLCERG